MAAPCKEHPHGAELWMPKAGSLKKELSEDRLAAGSQPGNILCQCRGRGMLPSESEKPGDKGRGAQAGSQVTEVQSQLPCFPHVSRSGNSLHPSGSLFPRGWSSFPLALASFWFL